jgi:hypothetical protein
MTDDGESPIDIVHFERYIPSPSAVRPRVNCSGAKSDFARGSVRGALFAARSARANETFSMKGLAIHASYVHRAVERMVVSGNPRLGDELGVKRKGMGAMSREILRRDREKEGSRQFRRTYFSTYKVCQHKYPAC